jgi:ribosomal protein L11 methyltransferase
MTDYILEIRYPHAEERDEAVQARLFLFGCAGSRILQEGSDTTVEAYFSDPSSRDRAGLSFEELDVQLAMVDRPRLDWLSLYQQSLAAIEIGRRFVVAPDRGLITATERLPIVIPQEQAFGTGSHETTALCLEELEQLDLLDRFCADIGTGSGILAMAMLLLGARKVVAFDNDLDAFAPIRNNMRRNRIELDRMPAFIGPVEALRGTFGLITMNIVPEVILPLLPLLSSWLRPEADLILSGILTTRSADVVAAAAAVGLRAIGAREKGEWWCGRFTPA